jgi:hypothetical protein
MKIYDHEKVKMSEEKAMNDAKFVQTMNANNDDGGQGVQTRPTVSNTLGPNFSLCSSLQQNDNQLTSMHRTFKHFTLADDQEWSHHTEIQSNCGLWRKQFHTVKCVPSSTFECYNSAMNNAPSL